MVTGKREAIKFFVSKIRSFVPRQVWPVRLRTERKPEVSVVVVAYNIERELPRTLHSLSADYQRHIEPDDYEVIVVDNGSNPPVDREWIESLKGNFRLIRMDPAPPSPAQAVNRGLAEARGEVIGVMVDGARIVTPGLLHFARHGARLHNCAIVATLGYYLGFDFQRWAIMAGYDIAREDALLESICWPGDGYRLFEISTLDESSWDGWLAPLCESNALFLTRESWNKLEGLDERFDFPGGGFVNLDLLFRALSLPSAELVVLLGEGTFHQAHGGVATNADPSTFGDEIALWHRQYESLRGTPWEVFTMKSERTYIGTLPRPALARFVRAAIDPLPGGAKPLGLAFDRDLWRSLETPPSTDKVLGRLVQLAQDEFRARRYYSTVGLCRLIREHAPDEPEPQRLLSLVAGWANNDGPTPEEDAELHQALRAAHAILAERPGGLGGIGPMKIKSEDMATPAPQVGPTDSVEAHSLGLNGEALDRASVEQHMARAQAHRQRGELEQAAAHYRLALTIKPDLLEAHFGLSDVLLPGDNYLVWLERFYRALAPEIAVEVGIYQGVSLALFRPPTKVIGIDPAPLDLPPLQAETQVFRETSDEFFARVNAENPLHGRTVSVAFIDGLHLFEQALRDFINLEARCGPRSVIILHDTLPLDEPTQRRERKTQFHTGDLWRIVLCLKHYRPDLEIFTVATAPSGLTVVMGLDPSSRILSDRYAEAVERFLEVPFESIQGQLASNLNLVPNDWELVHARLHSRGLLDLGMQTG